HNPHQVRHLGDHSANRRRIDDITHAIELVESESFDNKLLLLREPNRASVVLNFECCGSRSFFLCSHDYFLSVGPTGRPTVRTDSLIAIGRSPRHYPKISSSGFSRKRATSWGSLRLRSPSNVALMTLCGLDVPIDFVRMF